MLKKIVAIVLAVLIISGCTALVIRSLPVTDTVTDFAMNTVISVTVTSKKPKEDARASLDEVRRIESLMSATVPDSEISRINASKAGTPVRVSDEVYDLLCLAREISQKTDGIFDISVNPLSELWDFNSENPSVPNVKDIKASLNLVNYKDVVLNSKEKTVTLKKEGMSISLGALAKGHAADRCASLLKKRGVKEAIINLGGNIYIVGGEKNIGVQTPFEKRGTYFTTCKVSDKSVVTSGAYERYFTEDGKIYHHILDTKSGYPSNSGIESVTVISKNSVLADGLSTAFFAAGEEKTRKFIKNFKDIEVILLTDKGSVITLTD